MGNMLTCLGSWYGEGRYNMYGEGKEELCCGTGIGSVAMN